MYEATIQELREKFEQLMSRADKVLSAIALLDEIAGEKATPASEKPAAKPKPAKPARQEAPKSTRKKHSKYTGVSRGKPKADGTPVWKAMVWDGTAKKVVHLGTHESEELAAARVADHKGDKEEGVRLRRLHDKLNSSRPASPAELAGGQVGSNDRAIV